MPLDATIGEYPPRITPADAMVINFGIRNRVVVLWKSHSEDSVKNTCNGPSTQLIEATSCVEWSNTTMEAEDLT